MSIKEVSSKAKLVEHMAKFKISIQLNLSTFNKHFSKTNENTNSKSITNQYQHKFPLKNVISFTVRSLGCLEVV